MLIKKRFCCNQDKKQRRILPLSVNTSVAVRSSAQSECADAVSAKQTFAPGPRNEAKQWHFEQVSQSTLSMPLQMQHG